MKSRAWLIAACIFCAALAYVSYRLFLHEARLQPAIVTPKMDAQQAISPSFGGHVKRIFHEHITYGNRSGRPRLIALTFDDGPYPMFTPLLLDQLRALNVPATFFLIGRDAEQWPGLAQRIEAEGHEIADHTYSHPNLDEETPQQVRDELTRGRDVLWNLVHDPSVRTLMRPPHGRFTVETLQTAQQMGYDVVLWTDDTGDWRTVTTRNIVNGVLKNATSPDIVLMHSGKLATIEALPTIVERFRRAGYTFVTAGDLLRRVEPYAVNHPLHNSV